MLFFAKLLILTTLTFVHCKTLEQYFEELNENVLKYNAIAADIAWQASLEPGNPYLPEKAALYEKSRISWQRGVCDLLDKWRRGHLLDKSQRRQTYLLCRGLKLLVSEARTISSFYDELQAIYGDAKVCVPDSQATNAEAAILKFLTAVKPITNAVKLAVDRQNGFCLNGEQEFDDVMRSRNEEVAKWTWLTWREAVGPAIRKPYREMSEIENRAARRNGYRDIGAVWRDELEIANLQSYVKRLYHEVEPLYVAMHGVARFFLRRFYGESVLTENGPIPGHILGDLWGQNWGSILDIILPQAASYDLDRRIKETNWSPLDMVRKAEDFYSSMSLPPMGDKFWRYSVLERGSNDTRCHGTAANMFQEDDYRMLYCAELSMDDFYVIHHEMGHIQYYMAYQNQPGIFQEGANSAFHETIGDAIMYGVMSPQHLHRLGLISDGQLYSIPEINITEQPENKIENFIKFVRNKVNSNPKHTKNYFNSESKQTDSKIEDIATAFERKNNIFDLYEENKPIEILNFQRNEEELLSLNKIIKKNKYQTVSKAKKNNASPTNKTDIVNNVKKYSKTNTKDDEYKSNTLETAEINTPLNLTFDEIHLFKQALTKIPQIPFSLLIDEYRWNYFEGTFDLDSCNEEFWKLVQKYQGLTPPDGVKRGEEYFDAGAKFHVPDNTPYIRYFLSSFLQTQVYKALCTTSVLSQNDGYLPQDLPLHRCDIYGSKRAGTLLQKIMSLGASITWREALHQLTGQDDISAESLLEYYQPMYSLLMRIIEVHNIPLGWEI